MKKEIQCDMEHYYIEKGYGEPLILLHGNGENSTYFIHQIDEFSKDYRVIALDTRGHGKSPRGNQPFTLRQFADDLYVFMKQHQIKKAHLLGFSDGANIAMYFALKYPECVNRLVLNGGNLHPSGMIGWVYDLTVAEYWIQKLLGNQKKLELLKLMILEPDLKVEDLSRIKHKTLVIAGTRDVIRTCHTEQIAHAISNAKLSFVKGNHFVAAQNYKVFNQVVSDFLKEE